ncbi:hypothetical protein EB796_024093 [Bugula neritina]|uniref:Uncharacterized protein n=1 Tax=Bugula neritina TaxID=10212 RepID=A0A7J7IUK8_BUGNE|nr:hypothetical protein EB796_024093 [Bugula neritina]
MTLIAAAVCLLVVVGLNSCPSHEEVTSYLFQQTTNTDCANFRSLSRGLVDNTELSSASCCRLLFTDPFTIISDEIVSYKLVLQLHIYARVSLVFFCTCVR